jgi:adenine phosphoribosyltransferase
LKHWFHSLRKKIDKVIGIQSRVFFFGILIAQELSVGSIPARKANKLPYETISTSDDLEYGTDTLEIHTDAVQKGNRILINDDIVAIGGTAETV